MKSADERRGSAVAIHADPAPDPEEQVMNEGITTILVPVDFSASSDRAFHYATMLAHRLSAGLQLIHVVEEPYAAGAWPLDVYVPNADELVEGLIADAEQRLATLRNTAAALGLVAHTAVLSGRPAPAIVEQAKSGRCDLIVMGTHGRTGLAHLVLGSVAEHVVRKAPCPVLTVRSLEDIETHEQSAA
jgi:nucleotide-binding universal stress UspA family protein